MNFLVKVTLGFAVLLIVMGAGSYLAAAEAERSATALIPAVVGGLLLLTGYATTRPNIGRYAGMASAGLVLLLALGSLRGAAGLAGSLGSGAAVTTGMIVQSVIVVLSLGYLGLVGQHLLARRKTAARA